MQTTTTVPTPAVPKIDVRPMLPELWHIAVTFWPIWTFFGLVALTKFALEVRASRRLARSGIGEVDQMEGRTFELFLSGLFQSLGYRVEVTRFRGDYGADLVVSKDGKRIAVQAKRWSRSVGIKAVQEAVAATAFYGCHTALVVTNRYFTQQARNLAEANGVALWDRDELVQQIFRAGDGPDPLPAT